MKNIYVDTSELSGKLLDKTIRKMEAAKKKLGYNYSADAYLEVAINTAKYNSPSGRQNLFNECFAVSLGNLYGDIENVLKKLSEIQSILKKRPDELREIDERQKGELSNFWQRTTHYMSDFDSFMENIFGIGVPGPVFVLPEFTDRERTEIIGRYNWDNILITEEELKCIAADCNYAAELEEKLEQLQNSDRNIKQLMEKTIAEDIGKDGDKYWDWYYGKDQTRADSYCALFAAYHISRAGISLKTPLQHYNPSAQMDCFRQKNSYHPKGSDYVPKTGDILFVDWDGGSTPEHVGMIYIGGDGKTYVLHGNNSKGQVALTEYSDYWKGVTIGFGSTQELYASQQIRN